MDNQVYALNDAFQDTRSVCCYGFWIHDTRPISFVLVVVTVLWGAFTLFIFYKLMSLKVRRDPINVQIAPGPGSAGDPPGWVKLNVPLAPGQSCHCEKFGSKWLIFKDVRIILVKWNEIEKF